MFESYPSPYAPLEGTTQAPRALFIARFGTLLEIPDGGFPTTPEDVRFFPGALETLFRANRAGWLFYLIGNEDAVTNGQVPLESWKNIEAAFMGQLSRAGIRVRQSYASLERTDGEDEQRLDSVYLLPNTGAFYHASHSDGVDLEKSWVIGDKTVELVAGWRAGCRQIGVRTGLGAADGSFLVDPDFMAEDIAQAIGELLQRQTALHP